MTQDAQLSDHFSITYAGGAIRADIPPGASTSTLALAQAFFSKLIAQMVGRTQRDSAQEPGASPSSSPAPTIGLSEQAKHKALNRASLSDLPTAPTTTAEAAISSAVWLSDAINEWRKSQTFSPETWQYSYRPSFRIVRELLGDARRDITADDGKVQHQALDVDLRTLTRDSIKTLYQNLCAYPHQQGKRQDPREAKQRIADAAKANSPAISPENVAAKLTHIAPFLKWADDSDYINPAVWKELVLIRDAASAREHQANIGKPKKGYVALAVEELVKVFESDSYRIASIQHDWAYWVLLICLYLGMRIAEASQIHKKDLIKVEGVWCLTMTTMLEKWELNEAGSTRKGTTQRRLKTASSRRTVPIHPKLIELGFIEFLQSAPDDGIVFSGLNWHAKDQFSRKPREHYSSLFKHVGVHQPRRKVPHSVRSNLHQALKKTGLAADHIQRMLGHATDQMGDKHYADTDEGMYVAAGHVMAHLSQVEFSVEVPTWTEILQYRSASITKR